MAARPGLSGEEDYSSFYPELRSGVLYDVAGREEGEWRAEKWKCFQKV